ncbi:ATP-grasp domain-containing protein [Streptomyces sp. NPDC001393]
MSGVRVAVLYDLGSAAPMEIVRGVGEAADPVFVLGDSQHAREMLPVLSEFCPVTVWDGPAPTAAALRALGPVDGMVTFSERMLRPGSELAAELGLRFHSVDTAVRLTDKDAQRRALLAAGVGSARSRRISRADQYAGALAEVGLPAVVKPTVGEGSRNTYRIDEVEQGRALVCRLLPEGADDVTYQLEELLVGREAGPFGDYVSVESLVVDKVPRHFAVSGKFALVTPFRETGQFWPAPLPAAELAEVEALVDAALAALGVTHGLTHTEIKLTPQGPRIIEVNGRAGGFINELARRCLGVDLMSVAAAAGAGVDVAALPPVPPGVHYQFSSLAPPDARTVRRIEGVAAARKETGVSSYRPLVHAPAPLSAGVATQELDLLCGSARDHTDMFRTIHAVVRALEFTFTTRAGTEETVPGTALPSAASLEHWLTAEGLRPPS